MQVSVAHVMSTTEIKSPPEQVCWETIKQNQPTQNVGMIGNVAHGKSTLTKALSGITTGKFRAEQVANMTIKLGYANVKIYKCTAPRAKCPPPECYQACGGAQKEAPPCKRCEGPTELVRHVSLVDAPGHISLVTTMLSGASVMDAALLLVAADQECPCPQTVEHLVAAEVLGVAKNTIVVQNKVDLCTPRRCAENYYEIRNFLKGSCAEEAPIIPVAAQAGMNIDFLCQWLVEKLPQPERDVVSDVRMRIVRSFDVNKPGGKVADLRGGVVGGAITQGILRKGMEVEIRPGILTADGAFTPIRTKVVSLLSENNALEMAVPGGLIAVGLEVDPILSKNNRLTGQTLGLVGSLPPVFRSLEMSYSLLKSVLAADEKEKGEIKPKAPKVKEVLLLCVGAAQVQATVTKAQGKKLQLLCKTPLCGDVDDMAVIFRAVNRHWRLIGSGKIASLEALPIPTKEDVDVEEGFEVKVCLPPQVVTTAEPEEHEEEDEEELPRLILTEELIAECQKNFDLTNNTCRMMEKPLPEVGEITMAQIDTVDAEVGAYCRLLEYEGGNCFLNEKSGDAVRKALLISTEISGRRIRSLKQFVRPGTAVPVLVLRVDPVTGFVDISRKKVMEEDKKACEDRFGSAQVVHSIMARVSAVSKIPLAALHRAIVWPLSKKKTFPYVLDAFQQALNNYDSVFGPLELPESLNQIIRSCLVHRLQSKPEKVEAKISVSCLLPAGVNLIKAAFARGLASLPKPDKADKAGEDSIEAIEVTATVESPPIYVLTASATRHTQAAIAAVERVIAETTVAHDRPVSLRV